jgi:CHAT domain-containing protein/Tfp pilus assembly protein PilF
MFQAMTFRLQICTHICKSLCLIALICASTDRLIGNLEAKAQGWSSGPVLLTQQSASGQNLQEITPLEIGKTIRRDLAGGEKHRYQVALTAGQYLSINIEQRGIDVVARWFGADGKPLAEFDADVRTTGQETALWVAATSGNYRLDIEAKYKVFPAGRYAITLEQLREATEPERRLQEARELQIESLRLRRAGNYSEAIAVGTRGLEIYEKVAQPQNPEKARLLNQLGNLSFETGDYVKAEPYYQQALAIREKVLGENHPSVAVSLSDLGVLYFRRGDYVKAEPYYHRALAIRETELGGDHPDVATSLLNLANFNMEKGNFTETERQYHRALSIREKVLGADHASLGFLYNNLGIFYSDLGDNARAEPMYRHALDIFEKNYGQEHPNYIIPLDNLAILYHEMGDDEKAEPLYQRVLSIREKLLGQEHPEVANSLANLANLYLNKYDHAQAEALYRRVLRIREKLLEPNHPSLAQALYSLGDISYNQGKIVEAESLYQRALTILEKTLGATHPNLAYPLLGLARIRKDAGDFAESERFYQRVLTLYDANLGAHHPLKVKTLVNLATLYQAKGDARRAVETQVQANATSEHNLALNLVRGSERDKLMYMNLLADDLDRAISLHVRLAPLDKYAAELACTTLLQRKGRVLDAMSNSLVALRQRLSHQDQPLFDRLNDATAQLAKLVLNGPQNISLDEHQKRVKSTEGQREKLEAEISRLSAGFYQQTQPLTLSAVRSTIPNQAALIEFATYRPFDAKAKGDGKAFGEPRYIVYVLSNRQETQWKELGEAKTIDAMIDQWRRALRDPKQKDVQQRARAVDEKILQPVRNLLGGATHLLISPDGALNLIPFEALIDEQGKYLLERYAFTYLTSGRDLLRMQVARASKSEPVVVADPLFGEPAVAQATQGEGRKNKSAALTRKRQSITTGTDLANVYFAPLGGTSGEAQVIKSLFTEANVLTGARATEAAIKQVIVPRILHIATHGFFLTDTAEASIVSGERTRAIAANAKIENPLLRSGLALAGANLKDNQTDDGILTALEASSLNLWGTKLVTLSACDTGVGEVKNGEGVYGLRRAFVLAGAETLVMSLWAVSDYVTRELMSGYYKNLKRGLGRGAALRQVQLDMLKRKGREHPFYWASFIQAGEWANLDGKR